jgi:tocopherol O-methyltransferase
MRDVDLATLAVDVTWRSPAIDASGPISTRQVQRHYDVMSLPYRIFWGNDLHHGLFLTGRERPRRAQRQLLEYCSSLAGIPTGAKVLDVGCGYGGTIIYLVRKFGCSVEGLTLSPKQARIARQKIARAGIVNQAKIHVCDVERTELDTKYDLIWMMESSEHLHDKAGCIAKIARVLRPGGKFVIAAWTGAQSGPLMRDLARLTVCPGFQTAQEYEAQMEAAGLTVKVSEDLTPNVLPTWEICRRRVARVRLLWRVLPLEIQDFIHAIPLVSEAYRCGLMSYMIIVGEKLLK